MKKILLLATVLFSLFTAKAQKFGGFGYVSAGASFITSTQIQSRLQEEALFGNGFSFNQPGTHIGARVMGVYDRFLFGGLGYSNTFTSNSDVGEVDLKVVGRFFNMGYLIVSKPKLQVYSFIGIGSGGSSLRTSIAEAGVGRKVSFGPDQDVTSLSPEVIQNSIGYEFVVGVQRLINKDNNKLDEVKSGFLIGLVAGLNIFPSTKWEFKPNGTNVANMGNMSSFYFGITIGGGGFSN